MPTECVFDAIINHTKSAYIIFEDKDFIAFLDTRPVFIGHTLLLPKIHYQTFYDLPQAMVAPFFTLAQKIGKAVENGMQANGSFIAINNIISQSVPHLHLHIVPRNKGDGLKGFFWPRQKYLNDQHFIDTQMLIKNAIFSPLLGTQF